MAEDSALSLVFERNAFYRRLYLYALGAYALSLLVIAILITTVIFLRNHPATPIYFATDKVGRLIKIVPVSEPNMSTDEVMDWTINAVQKAYAYDYINYRAQIQEAQKYFSVYGWRNYLSALKASNNLVALTQRRWVVLAQVVERPKIINQGILSGAYAWKFEIMLLVTNWAPPYDETSKFSNPLVMTVIVQRQPILQSTDGLGIVQIIANLADQSS
jgi:intracellular multiplication protein IcmL